MFQKLISFILAGILCALTSASFAGLLDGTLWYATQWSSVNCMAFYNNHMYFRENNRRPFKRSILPYISMKMPDNRIIYINKYAHLLYPRLLWGKCDLEAGIGSYNSFGMFLYTLPLYNHSGPFNLDDPNWVAPKTPDFVYSFPTPEAGPKDIAYDGEYFWVADIRGIIYKTDSTTSEKIEWFLSPGWGTGGLAWDGEYLWVGAYDWINDNIEKIYKLDTKGNVITSFASPGPESNGLAWDGEYLWCADSTENKIYKLDTSGNVITSFAAPGNDVEGLAYDGEYLWSVSDIELLIYRIDTTTGRVVESFYSPAIINDRNKTYSFPTGLTWDGEYLWCAYDAIVAGDAIYKLDVSEDAGQFWQRDAPLQ